MNSLTFDIETRYLAVEIGGWDVPKGNFGLTTCVGYSTLTGRPHILGDTSEEITKLIDLLEAHDCVISFNGVNFDIPVIEGVSNQTINLKHHFDILQLIWQALEDGSQRHSGYRLTECCSRSLGIEKSGDGALAPQLARDGRWNELIDYCMHDVYMTRKLAQFIQLEGGVIGPDDTLLKLPLPDWFQDLEI